ncbi:PREDICTED: uncharacterized protein LOC106330010 [Brassica oleracea var. oleracea]|uniref:uncharacterized protein LOC106330010 n=1 Tax=Brassica oleracea var. oleracea TaxID=109376 RepID=UPI0006A71C26|nr:PREDICTED: uncharacterized protein LOC106330010 [Brassica oleracea var. oleracea]
MLPGNRIRIQSSGAKNRNKKARQDEVIKSQANAMLKYVTITKSSKPDETSEAEEEKEDEEFIIEEDVHEKSEEEIARDDADCMNVDKKQSENENIESQEKVDDIRSFHEDVDMDDLGNWKKIEQRMRDYLVERGPPTRPPVDYPFPRDGIERCFTYSCYTRRMSNGEKQDRRWLKNHETTYNHIVCMSRWIELEMRLKKSETIDKHLEEAINMEKKHWRDVMLRIIAGVKTLAVRNIAFRGNNEKGRDPNSGNFLAFIKMIGGFDEVMKEHIRWVDKCETQYHYLSHKIQNELIELLANEIKMLNIGDVKGQGYDNGSNMKGKHKGVQKRLLDINPRAFYTPCGCHSLNLALCDMASSTEKAVSFFGTVQRLYNLFSSTNNWEVYREMVKENSGNLGHRSEAECLAEMSKSLQSEDMDLEAAIIQLGGLVGSLKGYRETGIEKAKAEAMQIAIDMEIEPAFSSKPKRRKRIRGGESYYIYGELGHFARE